MPRIGQISGPYRFYFYSFDCNEPPHVHVRHERRTCKFWLDPLNLGNNHGFSAPELTTIRKLIREHLLIILEAWDEHCGE